MEFSDDNLTTNYDNFLYRYLVKRKNFLKEAQDRSEDIYSIRRRYVLSKGSRKISIWNIHGDVDKVKSMVIGYNHYCGCRWKLNSYIMGYNYWYKRTNRKEDLIKKQ